MSHSFFHRLIQDDVTYNVVNMNACHMLLERPWQFELNTIHHKKDNTYRFYKYNIKVILAPMKPKFKDTYLLVPKETAKVESMPT